MRVGICCSGVGSAAAPGYITTAARTAERVGFTSYWTGEHVVLFERYPESSYPYAGDYGAEVPIPDPTVSIIDPLIAMTWAAAATSTIEVGSGIVILPQRNPLVLAKQVATLDMLTKGRVALGVGVGWCKEEYDAIGADWSARGKRMDEYIVALRSLWRDPASTFHGETVDFERAYCYPKPVRGSDIPLIIGGESDLALQRVARHGDGWIAFKLPVSEAAGKVARLRALTATAGRDPATLRIIVAIFSSTTVDDLKRYRDAGVTEFNFVTAGELPDDEAGLTAGLEAYARQLVEPAARL